MTTQRIFMGDDLERTLATLANTVLDRAAGLPACAWEGTPSVPVWDGSLPFSEWAAIPHETPRRTSGELAAELAASVTPSIPVVDWGSVTTSTTEATVPVRETERGRATTYDVRGMRMIATIPFAGTPWIFTRRPRMRTVGGTDPGVMTRQTGPNAGILLVHVEGGHLSAEDLDAVLARTETSVANYLSWTCADVHRWRTSLVYALEQTVTSREHFLEEIGTLATKVALDGPAI